ncbi:uncharacterized protein RBU33_006039 [Hipposideros larvatus]
MQYEPFPAGLQALPAPGPPPPSPGPFGAQLSRPGKTRRGVPTAGRPPERRVLGWVGRRPGPRLLPRPWRREENGRNAGRIPGAQGRTCRQEVPCVHCPSDASHSGANAGIGALGLILRSDGESPLTFPALPVVVGGNSSRAASSRDYAASIPARCEREQARGAPGRAWARRPALPPPPPSSGAAGFPVQQYSEGGTSGEHPAELPPGQGLGCGWERQSPVSWLPVPSGPGQRLGSGDATPSPPHLPGSRATPGYLQGGGGSRTWMVGSWEEGASSSPTSGQISLPLLDLHPLLDPSGGGGPPSNLPIG